MSGLKVAVIANRIGVTDISSVPIIAAAARHAGNQVLLVDWGKNPTHARERVVAFKPDILAYSVMSPDAEEYLRINQDLREKTGAYSVFGGTHCTFFPEFLEQNGVDSMCVGEGDLGFVEFLNGFGSDAMLQAGNMHFKLPDGGRHHNPLGRLVEDLDQLPFPAKELVYGESFFLRELPIRTFASGRGCPFKCTYCFNHVFNDMYKGLGKIVRAKSVPYFIEEIKRITSVYPTKFLRFEDDIFGLKPHWLEEFSDAYRREIGLPFSCYVRPNVVNEDYCAMLKGAGCHSVTIAIEAGNDEIRNKVMKRNMSRDSIIQAFEILNRHHLRTYCLNILGLPGETEEHFLETIRINQECKVSYADASIFQPYPGTELTEYCKTQGYLEDGEARWGSQYARSILKFPAAVKSRLHAYHALFPLIVDMPWVERLVGLAEKMQTTKIGSKMLDMLYRFTYGYYLQRRIYSVRMPFKLKLWAAWTLLFSPTRN